MVVTTCLRILLDQKYKKNKKSASSSFILSYFQASAFLVWGCGAFTALPGVPSHEKSLELPLKIPRRPPQLFQQSQGAAAATAITNSATFSLAQNDGTVDDSWAVITLGDLHMEDDMVHHEQARQDCLVALQKLSIWVEPLSSDDDAVLSSSSSFFSDDDMNGALAKDGNEDHFDDDRKPYKQLPTLKQVIQELQDSSAKDLTATQLELLLAHKKDGELCHSYLVSLGDLGRKDIRHEPGDAGTTKCFQDAKQFLDGFGLPMDIVTGNHDLEGLDEFKSDKDNLQAFLSCLERETPYFSRQIGSKTLLLGLSTVRFRDAPHSSHEVHVDDEQLEWFEQTVRSHPANEGWKILVVSHAPIMGSGLRVLQSVHVQNGCAWLNHGSAHNRNRFIQIVKANPQIKCWASGHFHLSHDYEDSITTVGSCTFLQVGVIGPKSSRDGKRQTRLIQGCSDRIHVYSINHHIRDVNTGEAEIRHDLAIHLRTGQVERLQGDQTMENEEWFQAYVPREEDGCYIESPEGSITDASSWDGSKVCWWHMADGKVLGLHAGKLVEYDSETLSPLGVVVNSDQLGDRDVVVVQEGTAVVLVDDKTRNIEVIHPNEDGSYWRKFQRNKRLRLEEKAREEVAKRWLAKKSTT